MILLDGNTGHVQAVELSSAESVMEAVRTGFKLHDPFTFAVAFTNGSTSKLSLDVPGNLELLRRLCALDVAEQHVLGKTVVTVTGL